MSITEQRRREKLLDDQAVWLRRRGRTFFRDAGIHLGLSSDMVRKVFRGIATSQDHRVEQYLGSLGAPGFEEYQEVEKA
jgi:hypothetical protein